jgi:hypothetical protein
MSEPLTFDPEQPNAVLGTLARLFAIEGQAREVAILAHGKPTFTVCGQEEDYRGWHTNYELRIELPIHLFSQIEEERAQCEHAIVAKGQNVFRTFEKDWLETVYIVIALTDGEGWSDKAKAWLSGSGITNQGRVRSDNIAPKTRDGLLFRSQPEILLYEALKELGVSFAPLPVFIRGGNSYRRIEPDFIVIKDGIVLHVEVDGDTVHHETPTEAHQRTAILHDEGVIVERLNASDCDDSIKAKQAAAKLLKVIEKRRNQR